MDETFLVKAGEFEGPLDLLLSLIEKRKLFVSDVALAKVTDDYVKHIENYQNYPKADVADFILVAATLILIKSKSLLPTLTLTSEEEASIEDLEHRLKELERYRSLSVHLRERFGRAHLFMRLTPKDSVAVFSPSSDTTVQRIKESIQNVLRAFPKKEQLPKVIVKQVVSLEEMIGRLTERIASNLKMSFKEFAGAGKAEKVEVLVSFLAVLELVKQGMLVVTQHEQFGDIHLEAHDVSVPRY